LPVKNGGKLKLSHVLAHGCVSSVWERLALEAFTTAVLETGGFEESENENDVGVVFVGGRETNVAYVGE
jgi:hypothetical protein